MNYIPRVYGHPISSVDIVCIQRNHKGESTALPLKMKAVSSFETSSATQKGHGITSPKNWILDVGSEFIEESFIDAVETKEQTGNNFENSGIISKTRLRCGITRICWGGDSESKTAFKVQKRVIWIISGAYKCKSYRQIFKDYRIFTMTS
jgi:hypothetical protein